MTALTPPIDFSKTEYGKVGLAFAHALASGDFDSAHAMLSDQLRHLWPPARIQQTFERMMQYGVVTEIEALDGLRIRRLDWGRP